MGSFTTAFRPAFNKEGFAKLTFLGTERQSGVKDGKEWSLFLLNFDVQGVVRGSSQKVSIATSYQYSEDNLLGRSLNAMGFTPMVSELNENEEGFFVSPVEEDEDGFETNEGTVPDIESFLESCKGVIYIAKVEKVTEGKRKGFWEINVDTLKPFIKGGI